MELVVGINNINQIDLFSKLGVTEVYGGYIDLDIKKITNDNGIINGRASEKANFKNKEELIEAIKVCKKNNIKFNFTFNTLPFFANTKILLIAINNILSIKEIDNIIISDYCLISYFNDKNIIVSTLGNIYNNYSLKFFFDKYNNIKRIIFPRDVSIKDQLNIIKNNKNIEFEILILNDWCYYSNGMCNSIHHGQLPKNIGYTCSRDNTFYSENKDYLTKKLSNIVNNRSSCKVCSIYFFNNFKDRVSLKIAGRTKDNKELLKDILFSKYAINNIKKFSNFNSFKKYNVILYKKIFGKTCNYKNCDIYHIDEKSL